MAKSKFSHEGHGWTLTFSLPLVYIHTPGPFFPPFIRLKTMAITTFVRR